MSGGTLPREADLSASLPKSVLRGGLITLRIAAEALRSALAGGSAAADLREVGNKLEVFELFQFTLAEIGAPASEPLSLALAVRRATALDLFRRLWVLEGIGHAFAESAWNGPHPPRSLATCFDARYPAGVLVPLHVGAGVACAGRLLGALNGSSPPQEMRAALRALIRLCAESALPGYAGLMFEGSGFAACHLCSRAVPEIDRQLAALAPDLVGSFWHGLGRGLYFSPFRFLPGSAGPALAAAQSQPPHREGRLNAIHGAAWALALVNLRHGEVLDAFLAGPGRIEDAAGAGALAHGIASAAAIWSIVAGAQDPHLAAFLRHRPAHPAAADTWDRLVAPLCRRAVERSADLRRSRRLEELFRYRPYGDLWP